MVQVVFYDVCIFRLVFTSVGACCTFAGLPGLPFGSCLSSGADDDEAVCFALVVGFALDFAVGAASCLYNGSCFDDVAISSAFTCGFALAFDLGLVLVIMKVLLILLDFLLLSY